MLSTWKTAAERGESQGCPGSQARPLKLKKEFFFFFKKKGLQVSVESKQNLVEERSKHGKP